MFCSLKYLVAVAALWGIPLSVLALMYSQEQAEIRLLNDREMRLVAKGADPIPNCTTNSLYNGLCSDLYYMCPNKAQGDCNGTISCTGCTGGDENLNTSICNMTDKPWSSLCSPGTRNLGACGVYYQTPTCQWNGLGCACFSTQVNVNSPCDQPQQLLYGACSQVQ